MKKRKIYTALLLAMVFSVSLFASSGKELVLGEKLETLTAKSQNVILGKVHSQTDNSYYLEVLWELKGNIYSEVYEIPVESKEDLTFSLEDGDKVLVFVDRFADPGYVGLPHETFSFSKYDRFNGLSVFRKIEGIDYLIVSETHSYVSKSETFAALSHK